MRRDSNRQKWIMLRREILADIVAQDPARTWSVRELTAEMLKDETIKQSQPDLTKSTVHRDWLAIRNSIHEKISDLADIYTTNQLEMLSELTEELTDQLLSLKEIDYDEIEDPSDRIALQLKVSSQIRALSDSILKVQKRESSIVPNNAPKVLHVEDVKTYTLDMFIDMRNQLGAGDAVNVLPSLLSPNPLNSRLIEASVGGKNTSSVHSPTIILENDTIDGELVE